MGGAGGSSPVVQLASGLIPKLQTWLEIDGDYVVSIEPLDYRQELASTERGDQGWGHSGR